VAQRRKDRIQEAIADNKCCIRIVENLHADLGTACLPEWLNGLATAYMNMGNAQSYEGGLESAIVSYGHAIEIRERLRTELGAAYPRPWIADLAMAHMNRGNAKRYLGLREACIDDSSFAISLIDKLREEPGLVTPHAWLSYQAMAYDNRAIAQQKNGDRDSALDDYRHAMALWDELHTTLGERFPDDWETWQEHAQAGCNALLAVSQPVFWVVLGLWATHNLDHPPRSWSTALPDTETPDWSQAPPLAGCWQAKTHSEAAPFLDALASLLYPRLESRQHPPYSWHLPWASCMCSALCGPRIIARSNARRRSAGYGSRQDRTCKPNWDLHGDPTGHGARRVGTAAPVRHRLVSPHWRVGATSPDRNDRR